MQGEKFESFRAERAQLQATYGRLGQAAATGVARALPAAGAATRGDVAADGMDETLTATLVMQIVESVIQLRRAGDLRDGYGHQIAVACLRLVGLRPGEVARARAAAGDLLASLSLVSA